MNLLTRNIILLALDAFGGHIAGKTLLQKRLYFLAELIKAHGKDRPSLAYDAHYYGPYSATVASDVATLINHGLIEEQTINFGVVSEAGFEVCRYSYRLTDSGRQGVEWLKNQYPDEAKLIADTAQRINEAGQVDYVDLSIAAKAHWILKRAKRPLNAETVVDEAGKFSWTVEEDQIKRGFEFLERLQLASND